MISIAVLMVTGGWNTAGERTTSVELLNLDGSRNCSLPPLPEARGWFTQTGLVACGGTTTNNTCVSFSLRDSRDSAVNIKLEFLNFYIDNYRISSYGLHFVKSFYKENAELYDTCLCDNRKGCRLQSCC